MYHEFPISYYRLIEEKDNLVLLETSKFDQENYRSYIFTDPVEILRIHRIDEVPQLLASIQRCLKENYYLAGYFAYECGFSFEKISDIPPSKEPIAFFGVYHEPMIFNHLTGVFENGQTNLNQSLHPGQYSITPPVLDIPQPKYVEKIEAIKQYIRDGDTYQINFTSKYQFDFQGSPLSFYKDLKTKQRVPFGAFIKSSDRNIVSLSPELFFRTNGRTIVAKPMKGTVRRGKTHEEDFDLKSWLQRDQNNRSENVMIVDLIRNDLGRICEAGTVKVEGLCSVEQYQTLFQMTSTVTGKLKKEMIVGDIVRSLFPSGSVTGAPKIRSMQIINELEGIYRGVYTGAIGYFSPEDEAVFNVAIRTIDIRGNKAEMGVGSGIVYDSVAEHEYEECELKGQFLTNPPQKEFQLLETLLWDNGYPFLENHLKRIHRSANYFDYPCDIERLRNELLKFCSSFAKGTIYKIRLTLDRNGKPTLEQEVINENTASPVIALSKTQTDANNIFLYHKTTNRKFYNDNYKKALEKGFVDIIFMNERGEITEGTRNNIFVEKDGQLLTPPVECGLLDGIYRQHLLDERTDAVEIILTESVLREAEAIYICNAVRGMRKVRLETGYIESQETEVNDTKQESKNALSSIR
jgi:para-aminobenzoate synthetase/4-amino-4-deoxychorismate lyase